ncbi:hypothetical protein EIP91_007199 [Steccherinum ochraceum]|uniref:NACHT domain-containing protein n=1 Tax=Steccherinum ochraceum TaxID=92696 RepID=A0A4R0R4I6_9APHY|nr:hypothetical protein EIP91_007199 [Steccherinum ochraceum]
MGLNIHRPWRHILRLRDRKVYDGVKAALNVGAVAAESFPPAKAVIASLLEVLKLVDQAAENKDILGTTIKRLEHVEDIIVTNLGSGDWPATERLRMVEARFQEIARELHDLKSKNSFSRMISSDDDKNRIQICIGQTRDIITELQLEVQLDDHNRMQTTEAAVLLQKLRHSEEAAYEMSQREDNAGNRTHCLPGTRTEILGKLELWLADDDDYRLFWLNGMAGTGKSTIADSLARYARSEGIYGAGFFCSRDIDNARDLNRIFPSLAYQLAFRVPQYRDQLLDFLRAREYVPGDLKQQLVELILEPLKRIAATIPRPIIIIIDALDECHTDHTRPLPFILFLLRHSEDCRSARVKFFISSRPANEISRAFAMQAHDRLNLHDVPLPIVSRDIGAFVVRKLQQITLDHPSFTFTPDDVRTIVEGSAGLFVFASTVCRIIGGSSYDSPQDQLTKFTSSSDHSGRRDLMALDLLYRQVFINAFTGQDSHNIAAKENLTDVIGSIVLLSQPLRVVDLVALLGQPYTSTRVRRLLAHMHSVLYVPDDDDNPSPIRTLHSSFADHILEISRAHPDFHVNAITQHGKLLERCFRVMEQYLVTDNICCLSPHVDYDDIQDLALVREKHIPKALEYACRYWTSHLVEALRSDTSVPYVLLEVLKRFCSSHLLRWINVLAVAGKLENVVPMLVRARTTLSNHSSPQLESVCALLYDAERLVYQSYDAIRTSTLEVYLSALPFTPKNTLLYTTYFPFISPRLQRPTVLAGVSDHWDARLRTIELRDHHGLGNDRVVTCVAVSSDAKTVVCGTWLGSLMVWDLETGAFKFTLEGGSGSRPKQRRSIVCASFLHDGRLRAGTSTGIVRTWDADLDLGTYDEVTLGTTCYALAFSADGVHVAGFVAHYEYCYRPCVRLWILSTVSGASMSPGDILSNIPTVKPYNVDHPFLNKWTSFSGLEIRLSPDCSFITLSTESEGLRVYAVADVLNDDRLQDGADDEEDMSGDSELEEDGSMEWEDMRREQDGWTVVRSQVIPCNRDEIHDLEPRLLQDITIVVWSHRGDLVACAHSDGGISVSATFDALFSEDHQEIKRHYRPARRGTISSLAFSPNDRSLAVGYDDSSLCVWEIHNLSTDLQLVSALEGSMYGVDMLVYSSNGSRLISGSPNDVTVWDANTRRDNQQEAPHSGVSGGWINRQLSFSPDGRWLVCISSDGEFFRIVEMEGGGVIFEAEAVDIVEGFLWVAGGASLTVYHRSGATAYTATPTSTFGLVCHYLLDHSKSVRTATHSPDGSRLVLATRDNELHMYKTNVENPQHILETEGDIYSVAWSVDNVIAFGTFSDGIYLWDPAHPEQQPRPIPDPRGWPHPALLLAFSPDGNALAAYDGFRISVYDVHTLECQSIIRIPGSNNLHVLSVASDNREVYTDRGIFSLLEDDTIPAGQSGLSSMAHSGYTYHLGDDNRWILDREGRRVCCLPTLVGHSQQVQLRSYGDSVAVADASGRVLAIHLHH